MTRIAAFVIALALPCAALAELRCRDVPDGQSCNQVCDGNGKNCTTKCFPKMKQVCEEVSPPPQRVQPTGGTLKGNDGKVDGAWGGVRIPVK